MLSEVSLTVSFRHLVDSGVGCFLNVPTYMKCMSFYLFLLCLKIVITGQLNRFSESLYEILLPIDRSFR